MDIKTLEDLQAQMFRELIGASKILNPDDLSAYLQKKLLFYKIYTKNGTCLPKDKDEDSRLFNRYLKLVGENNCDGERS